MVGFVESFLYIAQKHRSNKVSWAKAKKEPPWHTPILRFATGLANVGVNYWPVWIDPPGLLQGLEDRFFFKWTIFSGSMVVEGMLAGTKEKVIIKED